jgi:hypothetical protein
VVIAPLETLRMRSRIGLGAAIPNRLGQRQAPTVLIEGGIEWSFFKGPPACPKTPPASFSDHVVQTLRLMVSRGIKPSRRRIRLTTAFIVSSSPPGMAPRNMRRKGLAPLIVSAEE